MRCLTNSKLRTASREVLHLILYPYYLSRSYYEWKKVRLTIDRATLPGRTGSTSDSESSMETRLPQGAVLHTSTLPTAKQVSSTVTFTDVNGRNVAVKISMARKRSWRHRLGVLRDVMAAFRLRKAASTWKGDRYR